LGSSHVFNHGWQLMMISNEHDPLQPRSLSVAAILTPLQEHWDEGLNLKDLGRLLHQEVVVFEGHLQELTPLECCMGTSHSHYASLPCHQVANSISLAPQDLKWTDLFELQKDVFQMLENR
jgi:hypothetical protein